MDKSLILNKIKLHYGFKSDSDFARFLGIKPNSLFNWYARNTMDYELVITKCVEIDANWVFSGEGAMLKSSEIEKISPVVQEEEAEYISQDHWKDKYIALLERYNMVLEERMTEWLATKR